MITDNHETISFTIFNRFDQPQRTFPINEDKAKRMSQTDSSLTHDSAQSSFLAKDLVFSLPFNVCMFVSDSNMTQKLKGKSDLYLVDCWNEAEPIEFWARSKEDASFPALSKFPSLNYKSEDTMSGQL